MAEPTTTFDYLLNAFEAASQHKKPATQGYAMKRGALYAYVRGLEASADAKADDAARLNWLDANAKYELVIDADGDDVRLKRWKTKYITYLSAYGRGIREAIDAFRSASSPSEPK